MAKATEINCPKCHAKIHMRFAGKDGIQCKRCYYWVSRDIMLKLISEQEGEAVVIQPEPEEEESFVVCSKCHHKTFYSKIMDGGVMCKKCYNWIVVEEEPEIPPVIEEAIMHRHPSSHIHATEEKSTDHQTPAVASKYKENKPEFAISGGSYIVGKTLEEIPVKAEKIAIVGKDVLPAEEKHSGIPSVKTTSDEESLDWFRHKSTATQTAGPEDKKAADVKEKKDTKDSWYISQEDINADKSTEPAEEKEKKEIREEETPIPEESSSEKKKSKRHRPRRKDLSQYEGGRRKVKAKSPGKESRVLKKATKKLVSRRKHEKEAEPETPVKKIPVKKIPVKETPVTEAPEIETPVTETPVKEPAIEILEDSSAVVTAAPEVKEEPKVAIEAAIEKIDELLEKTEKVLPHESSTAKEPVISLTDKAEIIPEKPVKEESAAVSSEPALAMPAPVVKEEKVDVDTVELPIPIEVKPQKAKDLSDDFKTETLREPPLELPPPPEKVVEPIAVEEKAIPMEPVEKSASASERPELDEAFIAAYLPKKFSSDTKQIKEDMLPEVPEEEIIALMPEIDMADEDILDFLVEPPDFEIPGLDAIDGDESSNGVQGAAPDSVLTDSTIMQIQQPEIVVRQIPASMRPKMSQMKSRSSKREDLDLPQKTDYSTTKLPKKPPIDEPAWNIKPAEVSAKPEVSFHKPTEPVLSDSAETPHSPTAEAEAKPAVSQKTDAGPVKPVSPPAISVRMRTPEIKKHSLPVPSSAHKGTLHPPAKPPAAQQNVPMKHEIPAIPEKPPVTKPVTSGSHPIVSNIPVIKKEQHTETDKTHHKTAAPEKPKAVLPAPPILNRKIFGPKKIDISSVFKKKQ